MDLAPAAPLVDQCRSECGSPASNQAPRIVKHDIMNPHLPARGLIAHIATGTLALLLLLPILHPPSARSAERSLLSPPQFQERLGAIEAAPTPEVQRQRAERLLQDGVWLSSAQVKAAALHIQDEDARLAFVLAAHPRTVDPENFYDVYDAFTRFSTVFRLHDRIRQPVPPVTLPPPETVPSPGIAPAATREELGEVLKALRAESFDNSRLLLARQIVTARPRFTSRQIREMLGTFTFDDSRLELAKAAYAMVLDPENYFVVNEAFTFSTNRDALSRHIQSVLEREPRPAPKPGNHGPR